MKKILHLTISSDIGGGPEHIYQLISGTSNEFNSYVACPDNGPYYLKFAEQTGGQVTILPYRKFKFSFVVSIYKFIKYNKIDILHAHGKGAGLYSRIISMFLRIPVVHTPHGINKKIEHGLANKLYILFEKLFNKLITTVVFVSQTEADYASKLKIWPSVPFKLIYNGTKIISVEQKNEWFLKKRGELNLETSKVIITASRFDFQKNTIEYCIIAGELPQFLFVILGDGEERGPCELFCKTNNIKNVMFMGGVLDPVAYFAAADIYLSTARWEGLSMAILESMAVGLPVVASDVIGNKDLVSVNETGFLYPIGNIDKAVSYILYILDNENYLKYSYAAKKLHEQSFSSEYMCSNTASLYREITGNEKK